MELFTKKSLFVFLMTAALFGAAAVTASANEYFVDVKSGSDSASGSIETPFASIQRAADIVQPGDTVIIRPGIYYENIELKTNGTKEAPIVFKAESFERDSVIVTGADRGIAEHKKKWTLEDAELGLYSIPFDYPVYRMTANDVQVVEYRSLTGLKTFIYNATDDGNPGYAPGYEHGFFYDDTNKKLYIRLGHDGCLETDDPNSSAMTINVTRAATSNTSSWKGESYGAQGQAAIMGKQSFLFGVTTESAANAVISGITFKMPAVAAVWARCHDLTVSNCWFIGCIEGVRGGCAATSDPTFVSKNIIIEHCFYTCYPIYTDAIRMIERYRNDPAARTIDVDADGKIITDENGRIPDVTVPKVLWFWHAKNGMSCNYEGGGLACYIGEDWVVRYCHFDELLDGFSSFGNFSYWTYTVMAGKGSVRQTPAKNLKIYGNKFDKVIDNAIEMEDNVQGMEIAYNEFTHQLSPFSWQPLSGIPYATDIRIHHNIVWNTEDENWLITSSRNHIEQDGNVYRISSPQYTGLFKLGASISSLAFWKSKFSSGLSKILPSTTMSGSALPLILVTPRRRIDVPAPRLPELATMSRPAIWPCRASSAEVMARPSTSAMLNVCAATDTSRSGMASPPLLNFFLAVTVTSLICVASCSLTLKVVRVPMGSVTVL